MFRFKKTIHLPYDRQGYIYFTSRMYAELPERQRQKIVSLCAQCGGEYHRALFEFVTTDAGAAAICMRHHLSRSTLERVVKRYYESFPKKL